MQYGASSSLTHVALSCGTSTCLNTSDFAAPFLLHSLTYSTVNTMSTSSSVMRTVVCALGARDTMVCYQYYYRWPQLWRTQPSL